MKKKFAFLGLSLTLLFSAFNPQTIFATASFNQGPQYEQGGYEDSSNPTSANWSHHSHIYGSDTNTIQWNVPSIDARFSPVVSKDGTIYATIDATLKAINPDGTIKWVAPVGGIPSIGLDGTVYANGGSLKAVSPDGTVKWVYKPTYAGFQAAPTIGSDGTIYVYNSESQDYALYAINPNGTLKWKAKGMFSKSANQNPVLIDKKGQIYVVTDDGIVYSFDKSGNLIWKKGVSGNPKYGAYAISPNGDFYVVTGTKLTVLNTSDGSLIKTITLSNKSLARISAPVFDNTDGSFYIGVEREKNLLFENVLMAFNSDGTQKWIYQGNASYIQGTPIIDAEGTIYFGINSNGFYAVNKDGTVKWVQKAINSFSQGTSPALSPEGIIYVMSGNKLHAIGDPKEQPSENIWTNPKTFDPLSKGWVTNQSIKLQPGEYKIKFRAKSTSGTSVLNLYYNSRSILDKNLTLETDYKEYEFRFNPATENDLWFYDKNSVGDISIKDIVLEKIEPLESNAWKNPSTLDPLPRGYTVIQGQTLEPGNYEITFKAKSTSGTSVLNLFYDSRSILDQNLTLETEYQSYSFQFSPKSELKLWFFDKNNVGDISITDIHLKKLSE